MNAQLENGYTRIANEIVDALCTLKISNYESRFLWALFRKTYGFHKKQDRIALSQFTNLTNIDEQHIARTKKKLLSKNIIFQENGKVGLQTDISKWVLPKQVLPKQVLPKQVLPKQVISTTQIGSKVLPKQVDTKEKKENIQKKEKEEAIRVEMEEYLKVFNETYGTKYSSYVSFEKNFFFWRKHYSLEEILRAVKRSRNNFWAKQPTPTLLLRTKNKNGDCDYIAETLNTKTKDELELSSFTIKE